MSGDQLVREGQIYAELIILDLGKVRPGKEKLVFGVIDCSPSKVSALPWQENRTCVGQWTEPKSWAYHPLLGTKNCHLFPAAEGKPYSAIIQLQTEDRVGMLLDKDKGTLHFFHNGQDMGLAFDSVRAEALLPVVSIRDKVRVRLHFPPPPYSKRDPKIVRLSSFGVASQRHRKRK